MWHVEVKHSTNGWTCNQNVFGYMIVCTFQYVWMLTSLWSHTDGVIQILVADIKEYIGIHDIGDSWHKDIYTELNIPKVATGKYNNVQLCGHNSSNFYRGEQLDSASFLIIVVDFDVKKTPKPEENNLNGKKWMYHQS